MSRSFRQSEKRDPWKEDQRRWERERGKREEPFLVESQKRKEPKGYRK